MPLAVRIAIQNNLIWTGDYDGPADGEFGAGSIAVVKSFQRRGGSAKTGLLTAQERSVLTAAAATRQEEVAISSPWRPAKPVPICRSY
jgi:peptidoglycan hydrolase-like protein with peptidoglycan-binding domain